MNKNRAQELRENKEYQGVRQSGKLSWQKKKGAPTNITPKKKKRK